MKIAIKDMYAKTWNKYLKQSTRNYYRQKGIRDTAERIEREKNKPSPKTDKQA